MDDAKEEPLLPPGSLGKSGGVTMPGSTADLNPAYTAGRTGSGSGQRSAGSAPPRPATPPRQARGGSTTPLGTGLLAGDGQGPNGDIKISSQVFVSLEKDFTHLVRKVAIETLEDE